jgi:hypothetical protein
MNSGIIVIGFMMVNLILFIFRADNWVRNKYKWYTVIILFLAGLILLLLPYFQQLKDRTFVFWAFMTPAVFSVIDYWFGRISYYLQGRDFYLWLRGYDKNLKIKWSDRILTVLLLYMTLLITFIPAFFMYKRV